jgi:hypothetical protein
MFIAAVLTIATLWCQPICPSANKRIKKCSIYTKWNHLAIKNEILSLQKMDGTREHRVTIQKSDSEGQGLNIFFHVWI